MRKRLFLLSICLTALICSTLQAQQSTNSERIGIVPRDTSYTVHQSFIKERKRFPEIVIAEPEKPQNISANENLVYAELTDANGGKRELHLNLYRPDDKEIYPALVMIHGGGWNSGDLSMEIPMALKIAAHGYVTVPVEYRLIPEALYPAGLHDLKAAIRWLRTNAAQYGIDPDKIAVSGTSAGGQLANLFGATNGSAIHEGKVGNTTGNSNVQAIINIDGLSDFTAPSITERAGKARETGNKLPVDAQWLGGTFDEKPQNWKEASPIYWVSSQSVPVCFINSAIPRFHEGRDRLIEKLDSLNIYSEVYTLEKTPHTFWLFHPWFNTTVDYMSRFLNKTLKHKEKKITDLRWKDVVLSQPERWYGNSQAIDIAQNVLLYQRNTGGWIKNTPMHHPLNETEKQNIIKDKTRTDDSTIDNDATTLELIYLSKVYRATKNENYKEAFLKGVHYLLEAQYPNGGWPQFYPLTDNYYSRITYNDNAMINVMRLLKKIIENNPDYDFIDTALRHKCAQAFNRGIDCILNTQYRQNGELTVWCAQHDEHTLAPAKARSYELPSLSGSESADIVALLIEIKEERPEVIPAIHAAVRWFEKTHIEGIRIETFINNDGLKDRRVVSDPEASPLWVRFYDLEDNRPFFCDRDGIKKQSMTEIGHERRTGYGWYTNKPAAILTLYKQAF